VQSPPLVVFPGALGDFVCLAPALREIGARGSGRVRLLCKGDLVPLAHAAAIAQAEPIEDRRASWLFMKEPPTVADRFFSGFSSIDSFTGAGVSEVERNLRRWQGPNGRAHPFRPHDRVHLAVHFLRSVAPEREWRVPPEVRFSLDPQLCERSVAPFAGAGRPLLVIHPGSGSLAKRWSRPGFREIARRWRERAGAVVVVLGPAEEGEAGAWAEEGITVAAGLELVTVASLLACCDAYCGNDSGVSHLAAAVGACGVALFGPTDPECWRPLSSRIASIRVEPWTGTDGAPARQTVEHIESALREASKSP
jgi:ADP-heptose:LPS heptosyltransferase